MAVGYSSFLMLMLGMILALHTVSAVLPPFIPTKQCFVPEYTTPSPTAQALAIENQARLRVAFNVELFKNKVYGLYGYKKDYNAIVEHPELDDLARFIAVTTYDDANSITSPSAPANETNYGFLTGAELMDPYAASIVTHADCLFTHHNANDGKANVSFDSILRPRPNGPEKYLGHRPIGIFALNILVVTGYSPADILQTMWNEHQNVLTYQRHNWMGIGVQYHDFATPGVPNTMTVCVILVYVCHPATPEGVNTTNWDMCSNVSQGLSTADAAVLGQCINNRIEEGILDSGIGDVPFTSSHPFCGGTEPGDNIVPTPIYTLNSDGSTVNDYLVCPPGQTVTQTSYGFAVCSSSCS